MKKVTINTKKYGWKKENLNYDAKLGNDYYWSCSVCKTKITHFFASRGDGISLLLEHNKNCSVKDKGVEEFVFNFGYEEVKLVRANSQYSILNISVLKKFFPEIL